MVKNQYAGYRVEPGLQASVDRVKEYEIQPKEFWANYAVKRRPVLIEGHLSDGAWSASAKWTDDYLLAEAGEAKVKVEKRDGSSDSYGKGRRVEMMFRDFVQELQSGNTDLYLTAQQYYKGVSGVMQSSGQLTSGLTPIRCPMQGAPLVVQTPTACTRKQIGPDAHGNARLFAPPLTQLQQDFVIRPELAGQLVPQALNLWMGAAPDGSSSGLHHDFHDNLYILLRGRKRFRLWDPSHAESMYTHGQVACVHPNGRIVYTGQGNVSADGTDAVEVARWEAERAVEEAEAAVARGEKGSQKRLSAAESALEQLLEDTLEEQMDDFDAVDDFEGMQSEDGEDNVFQHARKAGTEEVDNDTPPSFSSVDLSMPVKVIERKYPKFPGFANCLEVEVTAGEMLYLPAGWFHEVTSYSDQDGGAHLAFNYWFYPPDNLDPGPQGWARPYTSGFLPGLWANGPYASQKADIGPGHIHVNAPHPVSRSTLLQPPDKPVQSEQEEAQSGLASIVSSLHKQGLSSAAIQHFLIKALAAHGKPHRRTKPLRGRRHHLAVCLKTIKRPPGRPCPKLNNGE